MEDQGHQHREHEQLSQTTTPAPKVQCLPRQRVNFRAERSHQSGGKDKAEAGYPEEKEQSPLGLDQPRPCLSPCSAPNRPSLYFHGPTSHASPRHTSSWEPLYPQYGRTTARACTQRDLARLSGLPCVLVASPHAFGDGSAPFQDSKSPKAGLRMTHVCTFYYGLYLVDV